MKWRRNRSFTASKSISMQCTHYGDERVRNACVLLDHIINRNFLFFQPRNHQYSSTFSRFSFLSICVMLCAFIIYCNSRIKLESAVIMMHRVCTDSLKQRTTWMHSTAMGYHRMAKNLKKKKIFCTDQTQRWRTIRVHWVHLGMTTYLAYAIVFNRTTVMQVNWRLLACLKYCCG